MEQYLGSGLVLAGAFFLAVYNSWKGKVLKSEAVKDDAMLLINMLVSGAIMVGAGMLFAIPNKSATVPSWLQSLSALAPLWIIALVATGILNLGIQPLNNAALRREDTSLVTPLSSATPVLLILMSYYLLDQWPSLTGRIAIALVALGAYVLYLKGKPVALPVAVAKVVPTWYHPTVGYYFGPWLRIFSSRGAQFALLSAYLGSISINFDALIAMELNPALGAGLAMLFVGTVTLLYMAVKNKLKIIFSGSFPWAVLLGIAGVYALANILMASGYLYVLAPYVGALKRTQIFWTVMIATLYLGEAYARDRILGSLIITAGVVMMTLWP